MLAVVCALVFATMRQFTLPKHPPPELFGKVTIERANAKPVVFSHASHRVRYTCRVCHLELDLAMKRGTAGVSACLSCHDGKIAFADTDVRFESDTASLPSLPPSKYGNGVDWSAAIASGAIKPLASLSPGFEPMTLETTLSLEAEWSFVPPATFPHAEHVRWLDCANCHPSIFNVKKKTTRHFSMRYNLAGEFCGVCHIRVAFPLDDCVRCHPTMSGWGGGS